MLIDGLRAVILGDYFTPAKGDYAGQLGPWAQVVRWIGIDPRGLFMKTVFILFGLALVGSAVGLALNLTWAWWSTLLLSVLV